MKLTHISVVKSLVAIILLLVGVASAEAQVTTGAVTGSVTDPDGKPLARAGIHLTDEQHALARSTTADDSGFYRFVDVVPATYVVSASAPGFSAINRRDVVVTVDSTLQVDFQLPPAITQTVEVTAPIVNLQTASGDLGTVIDRRRVETLPLNRRDFLQLALLTPGVNGPVDGSELSSRGAFAMHANGAREESNDFLLDGVDNNDPYVNGYVVQPSVDSIEEFKVATNSYSAEYGRNSGGQVNVVTRRGTNQLRGFGYEYLRDNALDAANYFDEGEKQPFNRNQFGGGLGGPIKTDRTFFFGALDMLRETQTVSRLGVVPTDAMRAGDLSGLPSSIIDPFTGQPFPNNKIPSARISPLAKQVLAMFPSANHAGSTNYLGQPIGDQNQTEGTLRVDHRLSAADQLLFRYSDGKSDLLDPYSEGTGVTAGYGEIVNDRTWNAMAQHQHMFGNDATNSLRFGANGFSRDVLTENSTTNVGAAWGVNWLNVPGQAQGYPVVNVAGFTKVGDAYTLPIIRDTMTYQVGDDLTMNRGKHLLKIGGDFRKIALNSQVDLFARGQLSFTGALTGSGIGDLLLGLPTLTIQAQANNPIRLRTTAWSTYAQDNWRLRPDLTIDLGVRYQYDVPPVDEHDNMTAYNPTTGKLIPVGTNGVSRSGLTPDRNNFAPRLGVSWSVADNTVVRGAYGIFYDSGMLTVNTSQYFNPPQFNLSIYFPSAAGLLTLNDPFPRTNGFTPPPTLSGLSPDIVSGYQQQWNTAVQRELNLVGNVTVAYAGSKGSNLIRPRNINQAKPGPGDLQVRRPNPAYADIFWVESAGSSRYDSLQLSLDRPLTHHVSMLAAYTLSRSDDDASAFLLTPADKNLPQDSSNPGAEWGPSAYDVRHRLSLAYIVQLPSTNVWTRDTQVQGIFVAHSGQPFTPLLTVDNSNSGNTGGSTAGLDRPNLVGDPHLNNPTPDQWFNTAAFAIPTPYTFGTAGRNSLRGPGFASFDLGISRRVPAGRSSVTVEFEAFNLFNRANFDLPGQYADQPATFGKILSAKAPRELQLAARIAF